MGDPSGQETFPFPTKRGVVAVLNRKLDTLTVNRPALSGEEFSGDATPGLGSESEGKPAIPTVIQSLGGRHDLP